MSFGGSSFDARPDALRLPGRSMITGLIGNALGLTRADGKALNAIENSIEVQVAVLRRGFESVDFQTTNLQSRHMVGPMWTSKGIPFERAGSTEAMVRTLKHVPYQADAHFACFVEFARDAHYTPEEILESLQVPVRPLFLGRVANIPAAPIGHSIVEAENIAAAIEICGFTADEIWETREPENGGIEELDMSSYKDFIDYVHLGTETYWRTA